MPSLTRPQICATSSNAQTDFWQAQDKEYRQLYAATSHEDFLKASAAMTGGGAGAAKSTGGEAPLLLSSRVLNPHLGLVDVLENHALLTYQVGSFSVRGLELAWGRGGMLTVVCNLELCMRVSNENRGQHLIITSCQQRN